MRDCLYFAQRAGLSMSAAAICAATGNWTGDANIFFALRPDDLNRPVTFVRTRPHKGSQPPVRRGQAQRP